MDRQRIIRFGVTAFMLGFCAGVMWLMLESKSPEVVVTAHARHATERDANLKARHPEPPTATLPVVARPADARPAIEPKAPDIEIPPLPHSLRGTDVDGDLPLNEQGELLRSREAIRLFDYFLSAEGEESRELVRERILDVARRRLPASQVASVSRFFDEYIDYKRRLAGRLTSIGMRDERQVLREIQELQRNYWGSQDAERMFGVDNRLTELNLEHARSRASQN